VLPALLGRSTKDLARELGIEYEREVIHRDSLVVRKPRRSDAAPDV
jgi:glutamate 5-kinase